MTRLRASASIALTVLGVMRRDLWLTWLCQKKPIPVTHTRAKLHFLLRRLLRWRWHTCFRSAVFPIYTFPNSNYSASYTGLYTYPGKVHLTQSQMIKLLPVATPWRSKHRIRPTLFQTRTMEDSYYMLECHRGGDSLPHFCNSSTASPV